MEIYKSKIDVWLFAILIISTLVSIIAAYVAFTAGAGLVALVILASGGALPLWILLSTNYEVSNHRLAVRCGPFSWSIPLDAITDVSSTRNPLSSPALSLDRLEITYAKGKTIMVSPADPTGFRRSIGYPEI